MGSTPAELAEKIGRGLQKRDILVGHYRDGYGIDHTEYYEVVETDVNGRPNGISRLLVRKSAKCVVLREITPFGPGEKTFLYPMKGEGFLIGLPLFDDIIRSETRTENPLGVERGR